MQLKGLHHRDGFHLCIQHNPKQHTHTNAVWWFQASLNTVTAKLTNHFQRTRVDCLQPSAFSYCDSIAERADRIARELNASTKQET